MTDLAALPGVRVKLGGIGMPIYGMDWHRRRQPPSSAEVEQVWGPAVRWVVDLFGPDRCMFESNFPVDRRSLGYRTLWNAFVRMSVGYAPDERRALFHDTACRFYRLS
ncbi:MAG TPA: amidohydrolase family protein, partial [Acidimicrobiales bacterium]|nr:amidohydrolase family protein [Acidimicrobiales bacterium]